MNGDFKILYDLLVKRMDDADEKNDLAHKDIVGKIEAHHADYMKQPIECARNFVGWKAWSLIMTVLGAIVLGAYAFTWAYGKYTLDIVLKHIGG